MDSFIEFTDCEVSRQILRFPVEAPCEDVDLAVLSLLKRLLDAPLSEALQEQGR